MINNQNLHKNYCGLDKYSTICLFFFVFFIAEAKSNQTHSWIPSTESIYTKFLLHVEAHWPSEKIKFQSIVKASAAPIQIQWIETPQNSNYIGILQSMTIQAPFKKVEHILDAMDQYIHLFSGFDSIRVLSKQTNQALVAWEQHVPVFFLSNIFYQLQYWMHSQKPGLKFYRYQLYSKTQELKAVDGLIVIEDHPQGFVEYFEYDFYDGDWGLLKTFAPQSLWKYSAEGIFLSNRAIQLRAEHADWPIETLKKEVQNSLKQISLEGVIQHKNTELLNNTPPG